MNGADDRAAGTRAAAGASRRDRTWWATTTSPVLLALALQVALPAAGADGVPCRAEVRIEPRRAVVGQPVLYALVIEQRKDIGKVRVEPSPAFPSFRAEWLPTVNRPDPDEAHRRYEERRAIHPAHAGRLPIPGVRVLCDGPDGEHVAPVAGTFVDVDEVPGQGRPEDWDGLVGEVELRRTLSHEDEVPLGGTLRVTIRVSGRGNLWRVDPGLEQQLGDQDLDVFASPPELQRDAGRVLVLRRTHRYDLVPRRLGALELPALRIPYFDPGSGRYHEASLPAQRLEVRPRVASDAVPEAPAPRAAATRSTEPADRGLPTGLVPGIGLFLGIAGAAALALRRRGRRAPEPWQAILEDLDAGRAACDQGDASEAAARIARALEGALAGRHPSAAEHRGDHAALRATLGHDDEALAWIGLLERLERARFAAAPDAAEIRSAAGEADQRLRRARAGGP